MQELSTRERKVLDMLASGASNSSIATELKSTTGAIEAAIRSIYPKLAIPDTPQ